MSLQVICYLAEKISTPNIQSTRILDEGQDILSGLRVVDFGEPFAEQFLQIHQCEILFFLKEPRLTESGYEMRQIECRSSR